MSTCSPDPTPYTTALWVWSGLAVVVFVALFFVPAPYGRHLRRGWGPKVDSRWGWVWMELAAVLTVPALFVASGRNDPVSWLWLLLWELHYVHRAFVFPFLRPRRSARTPWAIVAMGAAFNLVTGYVVGYGLFVHDPVRPATWLDRPGFLCGLALFVAGMALNLDSDYRLLRLRRRTGGYAIPHGGGFRWVSCPNYLGEVVEWVGFALATASPGAAVFAWWTVANLVPRARTHHAWYGRELGELPASRRRLLPYVW
jgi:hypothetical protein